MIVAGIDYSTSSPAITITDTSKPIGPGNMKHYALQGTVKRCGRFGTFLEIDRTPQQKGQQVWHKYNEIAQWAVTILLDNKVDKVEMEDYAMGAKGRITAIAENTGQLKWLMCKNKIPFDLHAPTAIKKAFTGKGKLPNGKEDMINKYRELTGVDLHVVIGDDNPYCCPIDDIADSFAIALMNKEVKCNKVTS